MSDFLSESLACLCAPVKETIAIDAKIPMIEIATKSSIKENPGKANRFLCLELEIMRIFVNGFKS